MIAILAAAFTYAATVVSVTDGDTIKIGVAGWPAPYNPVAVRIDGIDTPESRRPPAKSACEVALGQKAKAYAHQIVHPGDLVSVTWAGHHEKYGRLLASVTLPDGSDFAARMVAAGLAHPYGGSAGLTKRAWCVGGKPLP